MHTAYPSPLLCPTPQFPTAPGSRTRPSVSAAIGPESAFVRNACQIAVYRQTSLLSALIPATAPRRGRETLRNRSLAGVFWRRRRLRVEPGNSPTTAASSTNEKRHKKRHRYKGSAGAHHRERALVPYVTAQKPRQPSTAGHRPRPCLRWPRRPPTLCGGAHLMPQPAASNDHIERASTQFWNPPSLEELMADVVPLAADEHFDIPDLTDEEWEAFMAALDE